MRARAKILEQSDISYCKTACKTFFEQKHCEVVLDQPIGAEIEWTPMIYAKNGDHYGVDIRTKPQLEQFWLETYRDNVKPQKPSLKICLAFPFQIALRLTSENLKNLIEEELSVIVVYDDQSVEYFNHNLTQVASKTANTIIQKLRDKKAELLCSQLTNCPRGREHFAEYEKICQDIFSTLFVPPLSLPSSQSRTATHIRRRDHIFPNHSNNGFWLDVVKKEYKGNLILLECKNLTHKITTEEIDDAAKYLCEKGTGLFALILSREDSNTKAKQLQISKWKDEDKLIIVIEDEDLLTMIETYRAQQDPSVVIQNKIDEFMLAVE